MKILFVASEVVPFAKTGGLADVAGALPKAIKKLGHDIRIFMLRYKCVDPKQDFPVKVYFYENPRFASRDELYCINGKDYPDNYEVFLGFCQAALPLLKNLDWRPDIIHCNDWQSGPVIQYLCEQRKSDNFFLRTAAVYSTHNIAYQGSFPGKEIDNFAKAGFACADVINTVSPTYAQEIQTEEYGAGLEELLKQRSKDLYGVLNGVDYEIWNPATDKNLVKRYSRMTLSLKINNKAPLQQSMGLPIDEKTPLIGIVSRLDVLKGFDIIAEAIEGLVQLDCQLCLLGAGDPKYHELFKDLRRQHPDKIGVKLGFDAALAEQIYAGSDMFLMPSKYEPCGLGQLISFKYGTIPIVRKTGGLADTVHDSKDGFVFEEYTGQALLAAIRRAIEAYQDKATWKKMQEQVMAYDYSWDASAKKYISLYTKALDKVIK
ncbi:MAG: glycogen synthase [Candidatus Margulisbacteria bacterium]|nr:glycogen synthase [Candidatus Margulisiibacteriota bacterium]